MTTLCPCGRPGPLGALPYERCCGRYLEDPSAPPPDPESLMRSRYTAHVRGRADWLWDTWDAAHRPEVIELDPDLIWEGLDVVAATQDGDRGRVEFVARWRDGAGRPGSMRERSRFVRREGHWLYVDGVDA